MTFRPPDPRYPFATKLRKRPPRWATIVLLVVCAFSAEVVCHFFPDFWSLPDQKITLKDKQDALGYIVERDLLRLEAPAGLDTWLESARDGENSVEAIADLIALADREGLFSAEFLWMKAVVEMEAGDQEAARRTAERIKDDSYPFRPVLLSLLGGPPSSAGDQLKLLDLARRGYYPWALHKLLSRLELGSRLPERDLALKEEAAGIKTTRERAAAVLIALLIAGLAGLLLLWKGLRRGVRVGIPLPAPRGEPPAFKAAAGAWALASLACTGLVLLWTLIMHRWAESPAGRKASYEEVVALYGISNVAFCFLPAWFMSRWCDGRWWLAMTYAGARLRDFLNWRVVLMAAAAALAAGCLMGGVQSLALAMGLESDWSDQLSRSRPGASPLETALTLFAACVAAPLSEELIYRGYLLETGERFAGFWPASVLSSAVFALGHYYSPASTVTIFAFGMAMCFLRRRSGKLSVCILAHAFVNLTLSLESLS